MLVVKLGDLGDLLTITPALRALRLGCPDAAISALVTPSSASLLEGSDLVDEVIPFEKGAFDDTRNALRGLPSAIGLGRELRSRQFDTVLLLHHLATAWGRAKYAALGLATGAPRRLGLDNGTGWFLTDRVTDRGFGAVHEVDYWLQVAALAGGWNPDPRPELTLEPAHRAWAADRWERLELHHPAAIVHPGSGPFSVARRWPVDRFGVLATALHAELALDVIALAGPAPDERALAARVRELCSDAHIVDDAPSPRHLAALLEHAAVVIGNDSGVLHLASAVERPIVAIFGPTNDRMWGPYPPSSPRHAVVSEQLACRPCVHRAFSFGTPAGCPARTCLQIIAPEAVLLAVRQVLSAGARPVQFGREPIA